MVLPAGDVLFIRLTGWWKDVRSVWPTLLFRKRAGTKTESVD
jgi:hypothetical protein